MAELKSGEAWFHGYSEADARTEAYRCYSEGDIADVRFEHDDSPEGFAVVVPEDKAAAAGSVLGR